MSKRIDFESIKKRFKNHKSSDLGSYGYIMDAYSVYAVAYVDKTIEDVNRHNTFKCIAANNLMVNIVTALEVYLKKVVTSRDDWDKVGYQKLLNEQISLGEAYEMFNDHKVTREFVIAHSQNFQNFNNINKVFSLLIGGDFFTVLSNHMKIIHYEDDDTKSILDHFPNWRRSLVEVLDIRHKYIHEGMQAELSNEKVGDYFFTVLFIIVSIMSYLGERDIAMDIKEEEEEEIRKQD